jgi:ADP-heptose:LPS heptosyltransferase
MSRRILVINLKFMGDLLIATPVLRALRAAHPDAYVAVLVRKGYEGVLTGNPDVDERILFDRGQARSERIVPRLRREREMLRRLRKGRFDTVLCMHPGDRLCLWSWASGASRRVGTSCQPLGFLLNRRVPIRAPRLDGRDYLDYYFALAAPLALEAGSRKTVYVVPEEARRAVPSKYPALFAASSRRVVGIHPGASAPARRWPVKRMAEVADRLSGLCGTRTVVFAGQGDMDTAHEVLEGVRCPDKMLVATSSIGEFAACLGQCAVLLCNDSGPRHLAAALGVRTVTIMGQKDPRVWGIYSEGDGHWIARKPVACQPCERIECADPCCMTAVTVEDVVALAVQALDGRR